jgi:NTE family protein
MSDRRADPLRYLLAPPVDPAGHPLGSPAGQRPRRAVVLGGGGVTGLAWEIGVLLGLRDGGAQLEDPDAIIGTSAGAFAGVCLAGGTDLEEWFARQFSPDVREIPAQMSPDDLARWGAAIAAAEGDPRRVAAGLGAIALSATTVSTEARAEVVADRLGTDTWPDGPLMMTALDAESGDLVVFDKHAGLPLAVAAQATGAVPGLWPYVNALGRKWIDGGLCSPTNAFLVTGYSQIVVIAPTWAAAGRADVVGDEVAALRQHSAVALIRPDARAIEAIGENAFDVTRRPGSADAGRLQGRAAAGDVRRLWTGHD